METVFTTRLASALIIGSALTTMAFAGGMAGGRTGYLDETPYRSQTFKGISALRAQTSGGSLLVEGGSGSEARVDMYVYANNGNGKNELSKAEIDERLANYDITIRQDGNTLVATARQKGSNWNWKKGLSISFRFYTPRALTTDISTSGGSIKMSHLAGQQRFKTSGGSIDLADLKGDIEGNTSGGSIKLTDCHNQIDLNTSGGSIEAANSDGTIDLNTSGGSIRLTGLKGVIKAKTSGGSISGDGVDGELVTSTSGGSIRIRNMAGSIDAETSAGSVEVAMTRVDKFVKLETTAGSVRVQMPMNKGMDLDLSGNRVSAPLSNFNGSAEKDRIVGKMNGGGIPVRLTANSGNVYINQN